MNNDKQSKATDTPAENATEAAQVLHRDQAVEEKYPQPEAVTLDASTRIATDAPGRPEFAEQLDRQENRNS